MEFRREWGSTQPLRAPRNRTADEAGVVTGDFLFGVAVSLAIVCLVAFWVFRES